MVISMVIASYRERERERERRTDKEGRAASLREL